MLKKFLFTLYIVWILFILYTFLFAATDYTAHGNIVSWWMLEEESGERDDPSANDNDLTDNNTVLFSADSKQGTNSADFERDNSEYLSITDGAQTGLDITGSMTIVAWIKAETTGWNGYIQCKQWDGYSLRWGESADDKLWFYLREDGVTTDDLTGGAALNSGTWYHVAAVFDASNNMHIYVNGSTASPGATKVTTLAAIANNGENFCIGANDGGLAYDGLIDEFAIFDTNLSTVDINSIIDYGLDGSGDVAEENAIFFGINFLALFLFTFLWTRGRKK